MFHMFQIEIQDDCIYSDLTKSFNAPICIRYGNQFFPDEKWTDFPVALMCMWIDQLKTILGKDPSSRKAKLFFLDGDYHLECFALGSEIALEMFAGQVQKDGINVQMKDFLRALLRAIRQIDWIMERHQYAQSIEYGTLSEAKEWILKYLKN